MMIRLLSATALLFACSGCAFVSVDLSSLTQIPPLEERVIREGSKEKILVVEILGLIRTTGSRDTFIHRQGTVERLDNVIEKAKKDRDIRGVILKIDSPGGAYTASDLVFRKIREYKTSQNIPVVGCIVDQGTSGAYMAALSADYIVALPSSVVGNVGVLLPSISLEGLMEKLGINNQTITSGNLKDAGTPLRDMSDEEYELLSGIVMEFHSNFMKAVRESRPVTEQDVAVFQDGRVVTSTRGRALHLIDEVGYYEDALKKIESLANVEKPTVIVYRRKGENQGGFYSWP
ncbi:MAG TPA: signal peptide peptidase SppA [Deltaproteobacteria bacterium]|jgi:protease-4|nr:signal peptide peptidase SppA [Deltaproteobacteria bacterium]MDI9542585.1 signal peptide peptidase SppA [Pseudomonadota bacterium]NLW66880.1 signal peptide peptidase SppA [Bacteriovoracaceae bacterium]HRR21285.1 signal peptide peptidase SppA [Desulfomonilia bacterium]HNR50006.1 signal peptide peptidase SppA [Deltaproteobacteria bacterium]